MLRDQHPLIRSFLLMFAVLLPHQTSRAESTKWIGDRFLLSYRSAVISQAAVERAVSESSDANFDTRRLGGTIYVNSFRSQRRGKVQAAGDIIKQKLSRKTNPCKRPEVRKFLKKMRSLGRRMRCEPDFVLEASTVPNDPSYGNQYASSVMSLENAWNITTGDSDTLALVIDTGVQYNHPDLINNMWSNPGEIAGNGIDDDGNGYVDDVYGINAITGSGDPYDDNGHGTHCAGILGAEGDNSTGGSGVAWTTKIVGAKFLSASGSGYTSDAVEAVYYGVALKNAGHNVVVSNNSWGGGGYSSSLYTAIQASEAAGILFVAAAGNDTNNNDTSPQYPAGYSNTGVIAVASTDSGNNLSSFSNYGATSVDIAAPGSSIFATYPTSTYAYLSGTSMATPQVTGVVLLIQAACGGTLTIEQVRDILLTTGDYYASVDGKVATNSIVNAYQAVLSALSVCSTPSPTPTASATPSSTPLPATPSSTPTITPTSTNTPTPSNTPTATITPTFTNTSTFTPTPIPPTPTFTPSPSPTATIAPPRFKQPKKNKRRRFKRKKELRLPAPEGDATITLRLTASTRRGAVLCTAERELPTLDASTLSFPIQTSKLSRFFRYTLVASLPNGEAVTGLRGSNFSRRASRNMTRNCPSVLDSVLVRAAAVAEKRANK